MRLSKYTLLMLQSNHFNNAAFCLQWGIPSQYLTNKKTIQHIFNGLVLLCVQPSINDCNLMVTAKC